MDIITEKIIKELQGSLPLVEEPYQAIADRIGISEAELLTRLTELKAKGQLKRIGAILKHQKSGYNANAMVVFQLTKDRIETLGYVLAKSPKVSHCYERAPQTKWPYNLYAMVHGKNKAEVEDFVHEFVTANAIETYNILFSEEELKKTSMVYVK